MRIETHYDIGADGAVHAVHVVHTERAAWNQVEYPTGSGTKIDLIDFLKGIRNGTIPIAGTGWDLPSSHPTYPGKTRLQVLAAELIRLNDAAARATLGV